MKDKMIAIIESFKYKNPTEEHNKKCKWMFKRDINILTIICLTLTIILLLNLIIFFNIDKIQSWKINFNKEKIIQNYNDNIGMGDK